MSQKGESFVALDGILLHRYQQSIKKHVPLKVNKITQPSDNEIIFHCFAKKKIYLYVSLHAQTNRIQLLENESEKSSHSTNFLMLLKKYAEGGSIVSFEQVGFDRIIHVTLEKRNDLFELQQTTIAIELMGKYANMILIDQNRKIIDALYRIAPYQNSKRIIIPTAKYEVMESLDKKSPLQYTNEPSDQLLENFEGFSPILAREFDYRIRNNEYYHTILQTILSSNTLFVAKEKPSIFHAIPLTHTTLTFESFDLHDGLTHIYQHLDHKKRVKDITNNVAKIINRELKKARNKKEKLEQEVKKVSDASTFQEYGDYCFMFASSIQKGATSFKATHFEDQRELTIALDPKLSAIENGQLYYKKYQKLVSSLPHLQKQIDIVNEKIHYFSLLEEQLTYCNVHDAMEIKEELSSLGFFAQEKQKKKTKSKAPNITTIPFDDDTTIYVGKNNIQNDYVTFKLASKKDTWFHTRHHHGAHVVVSSNRILEEKHIRAAAMLAAYYSKARHSSSVEVMYTKVANIKKIPQAPKGLVSVLSYQSLFIDPDESIIETILQKK